MRRNTMTLLAIFAVLVLWGGLILGLAGCATTSLPQDATQAERQAAMCQDSQMGIGLAAIGISTATGPDQAAYWQRYLDAAQRAHDLACPSPSKLPGAVQ